MTEPMPRDAARIAGDLGLNPLLTDLYQLNMIEGYLANDLTETAVFEFFCRKPPANRRFLVAAGLAQVVEFLQDARASADDLAWLKASGRFTQRLIEWLAEVRFTGDLDAVPEGTPVFGDEPLLRVVAPLPVAQLIESRLINILHFQTLIASKAARMVLAAQGRPLIDFGLRRAHGAEAGLLAARAAYLAGFAGTATVLAGPRFGIPLYGTMAHAFVQAHDSERQAFAAFARARPRGCVLLIDTFDTLAAAHKVVALAGQLAAEGIAIAGVRIDSGDLASQARAVRQILDDAGHSAIRIVASGGLDERKIAALLAAGAPIDGFGVGTSLTTSEDLPALDCAYKLQEYAGRPRRKKSTGKATWPGRKQIFRRYDANGRMVGDVLGLAQDPQAGTPLLRPILRAGRLVTPLPSLDASRKHAEGERARLPEALRSLDAGEAYPVTIAPSLQALAHALDRDPHD